MLLRSAAVSAGVPASVDVAAPSTHPPEVVMTLYLCWCNMLARGRGEKTRGSECARARTCSRSRSSGIASSDADLDYLRDRVEALGGRLAVTSGSGDGIRVSGLLPLSR